jgi:hypothetical protein
MQQAKTIRSRILGLHSKKERGKSENREGEKRTSVILGEKGLPP